ncbi:hypothetical protein GW931_03525 [archaeon]|nr:hypothetical protein [archaeon]PJC45388.1 MAG: hypothetical protein CO037_01725 [Candidatus Pacearchaeota archaeon CG_4_9_14_0_2_um_filter_30_8]
MKKNTKNKRVLSEYKVLFKNKNYKKSLLFGIFLLILGGIISSITIWYSDFVVGNSVTDLILDNIPTINLLWFRAYGTFFIALSILAFGILKPKFLPFLTKSVGLMYVVRALFIPLTHLKFYPEKVAVATQYSFFKIIPYGGNDLFFSGHVALPFMAALVFWENKKIRIFCLIATIISGIVVLVSKSHYSIDVFAAPFITYSIFKISEKFFKKDLEDTK